MTLEPALRESLRKRLNAELAALFARLGPVQDALSAITRKAEAENWDMDRYLRERASLMPEKERIATEVTKRL